MGNTKIKWQQRSRRLAWIVTAIWLLITAALGLAASQHGEAGEASVLVKSLLCAAVATTIGAWIMTSAVNPSLVSLGLMLVVMAISFAIINGMFMSHGNAVKPDISLWMTILGGGVFTLLFGGLLLWQNPRPALQPVSTELE